MIIETDRELLELAAKAAALVGMPIIQSVAGPQILERTLSDGTECYRQWHPENDDEDGAPEYILEAVTAITAALAQPAHSEWNAALDEAAAQINAITAFHQTTKDSFAVFIQGLKK